MTRSLFSFLRFSIVAARYSAVTANTFWLHGLTVLIDHDPWRRAPTGRFASRRASKIERDPSRSSVTRGSCPKRRDRKAGRPRYGTLFGIDEVAAASGAYRQKSLNLVGDSSV